MKTYHEIAAEFYKLGRDLKRACSNTIYDLLNGKRVIKFDPAIVESQDTDLQFVWVTIDGDHDIKVTGVGVDEDAMIVVYSTSGYQYHFEYLDTDDCYSVCYMLEDYLNQTENN